MRSVAGPTEKVVVVGAGLAGLSAALRLAGAGRAVTVLERGPGPGGHAGQLAAGGYLFDTGPTVLTMPDLLADALDCVGERLDDWLTLHRLDPAYRGHFPDGSTLDVRATPAATEEEIRRVCGPAEAAGYRRFVRFVTELYRIERRSFIERNFDSPADLLGADLARLAALGGFRRLAPRLRGFFADPRTRRMFSFSSLYVGCSPDTALALYAVVSYLDTVAGVWFPAGGLHAVPQALAGAAGKHGVQLRYATAAAALEWRGGRAVAVRTADGERVPADAVVLAGETAPFGLPRGRRKVRLAPSAVVVHLGASTGYGGIAHHNLHFGRAWRRTFRELLTDGRLPVDPSLLVTNPTRTDRSLAPAGGHAYYALMPVPNLAVAPGYDYDALAERLADEVVGRLEAAGYRGLAAHTTVRVVRTPADWLRAGCAGGTPFAAAHTFAQSGPFRSPNLLAENVVTAGAATVPGVGVPMVLLSGKLAAARVLGAP